MKRFSKKIIAVMSAICVLFGTVGGSAAYAETNEKSILGASDACTENMLSTFNGLPACVNENGELHICKHNFPEEAFQKYMVESMQSAADGYFTLKECAEITSLFVSQNYTVNSMKGIEFFTNLRTLYCSSNQLVKLDLSSNTELRELECRDNFLRELNVSGCPQLWRLDCSNNLLSELNMSGNTKLIWLYCNNNWLEELNVSGCTALERLYCNNTRLTELNVSDCTALEFLNCSNNSQLTKLDLGNNIALDHLQCDNNQLAELNVSGCTALAYLYCDNNQLTKLDLSSNTELRFLRCSNNLLAELDMSNNSLLEELNCDNNQLAKIYMGKGNKIERLYCSNNQLTELDLRKMPDLSRLECSDNQLTTLDMSMSRGLGTLVCYNNSITRIEDNGIIGAGPSRLISPQIHTLPLIQEGDTWTVDLRDLVSLSGVCEDSFSEGTFDSNTGLVTFTEKPTSFSYECNDFGLSSDQTMQVTINLIDPFNKATINGIEYEYAADEQVTLATDAFYTDNGYGYRFDQWIGDVDMIADATASTTTLTMPAHDVAITSAYYLIGDVDGNGVVDAMDAAAIIRMASGKQTSTPAGDITGTGIVDAMSVSNITKYIVGTYIPTK